MDKDSPIPVPSRPPMVGRRQAVSTGHPLATAAATRVLDRGGNAIDAGVAAGLALHVLQPDLVQFGGVAPIIIYHAASKKVVTISGLGRWPRRASAKYFQDHYAGDMPRGVLLSVVPSAVDAWITALEHYGTIGFGEASDAAYELAHEGYAVHRVLAAVLAENENYYARWPSSAAILMPNGRLPRVGELLRQPDLARTIDRIRRSEAKAPAGRVSGLNAARSYFYEGEIAAEIGAYYASEGGLLTMKDLRDFRVKIEPAESVRYRGFDVYSCGPWCQGPMLLEFLNLVEDEDLVGMGHNSAVYVHRLLELMKLGFADREAYFGDPEFIDVPLGVLLSKDYARQRRRMVSNDRAWPDMPAPGDVGRRVAGAHASPGVSGTDTSHLDTTYLCIVDKWGNAFSATPSDGSYNAPIVPGLGFAASPRGNNSWAVEGHPSAVAPWKRPRLTPNPALALKDGELFMTFGTPGADVQCQAMLQVLLNVTAFGMDAQAAIDAPRFTTHSFPNSFHPHHSQPGVISLDPELAAHRDRLSALGHTPKLRPHRDWRGGGVCAIIVDPHTGHRIAGADPRRECYALAW